MSRSGTAKLLTVFISVVLCGLITVWTLAPPDRDPIGDAVYRVSAQLGDLTEWYDHGPVDAKPDWDAMRMQVLNGDATRGRVAMLEYGCGSCHIIPGVAGARGTVGPSLSSLVDRAYIAGVLTNAPGDLTRWLVNPPLYAPDTAMPDLGVTEQDAADMAAYLYAQGANL